MHYQPTLTESVLQPLRHLVANFSIVGASSACFLDLGCGRGKALHVAKFKALQHATTVGIDLHPGLLEDAARNLRVDPDRIERDEKGIVSVDAPKVQLRRSNVLEVDYAQLLSDFDVVIVFNKNSFDREVTEETLKKITDACHDKALFYIYNNPVFDSLFEDDFEAVFSMSGWHKNWNTKVFRKQELKKSRAITEVAASGRIYALPEKRQGM